jgi:4-hydroxyphenylpyruvate dioxygenase
MHSESACVIGIDHLKLYVSNLYQAAHFYRSVLGFGTAEKPTNIEDDDDERSVCLRRGAIRLVLTAPAKGSGLAAEHLRIHGEGIKDIALAVAGLDELFDSAVASGGQPIVAPVSHNAAGGTFRTARIGVFGDVVHTLIEDPQTTGKGQCAGCDREALDTGLQGIDHLAMALDRGDLDKWVAFYLQGLGFLETHQEYVSTEYSAMRSKVVQSSNGLVRFPMMEPASGKRKSQIEHFLEANQGSGVQHMALQSNDIVKSVSTLAAHGLAFLPTPGPYYETLEERVGGLSELGTLAKFGILADRDPKGLLLQVFTIPIGTRPTLFLELVERRGAEGFGSGNIRALFEAVERAQASAGGA